MKLGLCIFVSWRGGSCYSLGEHCGSQTTEAFERDYLLPAPSRNFAGVQIREPRYDTAFGVQSRILSSLFYHGNRLFNFAFPHFWSPHSGRNFLPTAASVLAFRHKKKVCSEVGRHVAANSTIAWPSTKSRRSSAK